MALAHEDSPVFVAGGASVLSSMYADKDKIVKAMRGDGALAAWLTRPRDTGDGS